MRTVSVRLMADASNFRRTVQGASNDVKGLVRELQAADKRGNLDELTGMATGLGIGLLGAAGAAVKFSMDFEKQMSAVKAATHASAAEIDALKKASLQAGKATQFSATQAAKGVEELAKAGVSTADILGGGLKGALDLAAAGELEVGQAAETAASALTQFKLRGQDVPHVADLLAAAAGKAQGSVADMSAALNQAGLIAAQTGLSIEDTTGTLAAFANAGLLGSDAGTSFKTMLQALQAPSGKTKELMQDLGISAYDVQGNFIGITALAGQLKTQLSKLTPELRANALAQIFGSDATRAASILYEQGQEGIQGWIDKTNDAGYAAKTAAEKTDNLVGDLERLKGALETQAVEAGGGLNGGLRFLTKSAEALVETTGKLPPAFTSTLTVMAAVGGALVLAGVAWVKARTAIAAAVVELNAVGPAGARAATGLQVASKWAGRATGAFLALEVAGAVFDKFGNGEIDVTKLTAALQDYAATGKTTQSLTDGFGKDLEFLSKNAWLAEQGTHGLGKALNDLTFLSPIANPLAEWATGTSISDSTERMKALDESFTAFIATQTDSKKAGELWNLILLKSGLDTQQLQALLPQTSAAMTELQKTSHGATGAQGQLAAQSGKTAEQLEQEKEAATQLKKAFDDLFGRYMSADEAALNYQETLAATNKELKSGSKSLDVNKEAGRENRKAILNLIGSIKDQRQANIDNGMSVEEADRQYKSQIETLKKNATNLGFNKTKVGELVDKYRDVPNKVGTSVETPGLPKSREGIKGYHKQLDKLTRQIKTHVSVEGDAAAYKKLERLLVAQQAAKKGISVSAAQSAFNKNAKGYRSGGRTANVGEHEPAGVVHGKEVVFSAATTKKIDRQAPGFIDEVLATGQLPGYAGGGRVLDMPFRVNASMTKAISMAEALSKVAPSFGNWPSSPGAQRGDSGVWRKVLQLIKSGPNSGSFGNAYRPGDPKWHGCVPMDTRILTRRGWITQDEVVVGEDEAIGYNPATGKNEWTLIVGMHRYEDAEVWKLQNAWFTAEVTPGHKWLVDQQVTVQTETKCTECDREFATGRGMAKHRADVHGVLTPRRVRFEEQLVATRDFKQTTRIRLAEPADLGEQLPITDAEAELIGWIFGDGYMEPNGPTIVQSKPEEVQYLKTLMAQFPCGEYVRAPEGRQNFTIFRWKLSKDYWDDLASRSKASKDDALNFVFSLSPSQREAFVRGFLSADGTRDLRTQDDKLGYSAFQVSGPVAEAIKVAAYLEGYRPDTRVKTEFDDDRFGTQPMEHIGFRTSVVTSRNLPVVEKRTADVWCPTTTLGTWTARQGEEIFLTGNSGRAVDWMGYNQNALASYLASKRPLELIHRTNKRDYAYTRGVNKGSFNNALMQAHRNHIHIAMGGGGIINEHVVGVGQSGTTYEFGEGGQPETVTPGIAQPMAAGGGKTVVNHVTFAPTIVIQGANQSPQQIAAEVDRRLGSQVSQYVRGITA